MSQRLVRRLDDETKIAYTPDKATVKWIKDNLGELPESVEKPDLDNLTLYKPGSRPEYPFGYVTRTMITEQLMITDRVARYIRRR